MIPIFIAGPDGMQIPMIETREGGSHDAED